MNPFTGFVFRANAGECHCSEDFVWLGERLVSLVVEDCEGVPMVSAAHVSWRT